MKRFSIVAVAVSAFLAVSANAQTYDYVLTKGKETSSVRWVETDEGNGRTIDIHVGGQIFRQTVDNDRKTTYWHYIYDRENTDYEVTLKDGIYTFKGRLKDRTLNKTEKSKGHHWYQNISYKAGVTLKNTGESLVYECIRMDNASLNVMQVTNIGQEPVNGKMANHLKITPTGALAKLWTCHEYCDPDTGVMVSYSAVEGVPGTPETKWTIK